MTLAIKFEEVAADCAQRPGDKLYAGPTDDGDRVEIEIEYPKRPDHEADSMHVNLALDDAYRFGLFLMQMAIQLGHNPHASAAE